MATVIGDVAIDVALSEDHSSEAEATEYPVESGADVTDHVRLRPLTYSLEGIVSDTPTAANTVLDPYSGITRREQARQDLMAILAAREPVAIQTNARAYDSMVMESLVFSDDAETGYSLRFRAAFRQLVLVTNNRTVVRTSIAAAAKGRDLGNKKSKVLEFPFLGIKLPSREQLDYDDPRRWSNPTRTSAKTSGPFRWQ